MTSPPTWKNGNRLLSALSDAERERIGSAGEIVDLDFKQVLYEFNEPIEHVLFPNSGVVSWLSASDGGELVEVATVGREGFVGLPVFLGAGSTPGIGMAQIPGSALRVPADTFQRLVAEIEPFRAILNRYTQALMTLIAQGSLCNRIHAINERCARWLLMTHDAVDGDEYPLTHEFLSQMLGVRRASVTVAAGMLQRAGLIEYQRGVVTVLDRDGLEAAACDCYGIISNEFDRLIGAEGK